MITILFFLHFLSTDFFWSTEFFCPQIITDFIKARKSAAFSKTRLGSALILSTALRDYGLLRKFTA